MKDVHDITFKSLMQEKKFFQSFFKQYLPAHVAKNIDWSTTQVFNISGEHIREVFPFDHKDKIRVTKDLADLAYIVEMNQNGKKKKTLISLHVEHQSNPDKLLPLRMALYIVGMLYEYAKVNDTDALPQVFSLIYYHGKQSPYPHKKDIWSMFDESYSAEQHLLNPIFIDVGTIPDEELLTHGETAGAELAFKHIFAANLGKYIDIIAQSLQGAGDNTTLNVLRYMLNAGEAPNGEAVVKRLRQALPKEDKLIMTIAEQLSQERCAKASFQGKLEGELETKKLIAKTMLSNNFDLETVKNITGLTHQELKKLMTAH